MSYTDGFFVADTHWTCLDAVVGSILTGTSLIAICGEPGSGKTTIVDAALARLDQQPIQFIRVASAGLRSFADYDRMAGPEILDQPVRKLMDHLQHAGGCPSTNDRICLVIDDAETLGTEALYFLQQLIKALTARKMPLAVLFIGRPEFWRLVEHPALGPLRRQIATRLLLSPLSNEGVCLYSEHLLRRAGYSVHDVMSKASLRALVRLAHGNPRRINSLLAISLDLRDEAGKRITKRTIYQAAAVLGDGGSWSNGANWVRLAPSVVELAKSQIQAQLVRTSKMRPTPRYSARPEWKVMAAGALLCLCGGVGLLALRPPWLERMLPFYFRVELAGGSRFQPLAVERVTSRMAPFAAAPAVAREETLAFPRATAALSADQHSVDRRVAGAGALGSASPSTEGARMVPDASTVLGAPSRVAGPDRPIASFPLPSVSSEASVVEPAANPALDLAAQAVPEATTHESRAPDTALATMAATLLKRGDEMLVLRDIVAARLLYERAAAVAPKAAAAAAAVGKTYDPSVLATLGLRGVVPDPDKAARWYDVAIALGDSTAKDNLRQLRETKR